MASGSLTFDRYMAEHYQAVPGMSSAFAAKVCAGLMRIQDAAGWSGNIAEVGAFEGRFLVALALTMRPDEKAIAIDLFDWPDIHVNVRLADRLRSFGLADRVDIVCADSRRMTPDMLSEPRYSRKIRLFHIDGDHSADSLAQDMSLAFGSMEPWGVICLDDMLSPAYPDLGATVADTLRSHPDWSVFCVIDREDIVAQSKFLLCRREFVERYTAALTHDFRRNVWGLEAQFAAHRALVLTPQPRLPRFHADGLVEVVQ